MKGLLIKDFKLLKMQRLFFVVLILMAAGMAFSMGNLSFVVGYLGFIMPLFVLSTISYDEFDNGSAFLFTLPISRTGYVVEKYCFGLLLELVSLAISLALALCVGAVTKSAEVSDALFSAPFIFMAVAVLLGVAIPLQIKFGAEKGRIAMVISFGLAAVIGYGIVKAADWLGLDPGTLEAHLSKLHLGVLIAGAATFTLCVLLLSMKISITILRRKEF